MRLTWLVVAACGSATTQAPPPAQLAPLADGEHAVDAGGVHLAYHVFGQGPICVVHSGGPGLEWNYLRMPEVEKVMRLVYLEPVGTGASSALHDPKAYTLARYAELLDDFRAALGLDKMCVLGHSYGGFIAEHWAIAHPDRVSALILYDTSPRSSVGDGAAAAAFDGFKNEPWFADAMKAAEHEESVTDNADADRTFRLEAPIMFADWTHGHYDLTAVHAYVEPLRGSVVTRAPWDVREQLATLHVPTLVIVGAKDWITPPARAAEIASAIPGAQLVTLPNSGHMGHLEEPQAFAAAIATFAAGFTTSQR